MTTAASDLAAAARSAVRRPWASAGVILTLGLGLAAVAVAGAIAHTALLAPLPFPDADRIVRIERVYTPNALVSGRWLASSVPGVAPSDYRVLAVVIAGVLVLATAASAVPARRASRADPLSLLKSE